MSTSPGGTHAFVPCLFSSQLMVLNLKTHKPVLTPSPQAKPTMGTVSWNSKYWVVEDTAGGKNLVSVYSLAKKTHPALLADFAAGIGPTTDEITPNSKYAFEISSGNAKKKVDGSVEVIALGAKPKIIKTIKLPGFGDTVGAFSPDGSTFYVNLPSAGAVAAIDVKTMSLITTIKVGKGPAGLFASTYQWVKH